MSFKAQNTESHKTLHLDGQHYRPNETFRFVEWTSDKLKAFRDGLMSVFDGNTPLSYDDLVVEQKTTSHVVQGTDGMEVVRKDTLVFKGVVDGTEADEDGGEETEAEAKEEVQPAEDSTEGGVNDDSTEEPEPVSAETQEEAPPEDDSPSKDAADAGEDEDGGDGPEAAPEEAADDTSGAEEDTAPAEEAGSDEEEETGAEEEDDTEESGGDDSVTSDEMSAADAAKHIRDTDKEDLEGFLAENESRKTVLDAWDKKFE